jgi:large subunit ribosomal protein L30
MSAKKPKRKTKSSSEKAAKTKSTRVTRTKKKPEKEAASQPEVKKPVVEAKPPEPKEPVESKKPIAKVEPETKPPTQIKPPEMKPEIETPGITKPEVVEVKYEPEKTEVRPAEIKPIVVKAEPEPEPEIIEVQKAVVEVKAEPKKPEVKPEIKKRIPVKRLPKPLPKKKLPQPPKESVLLVIRLRGTFAVPYHIERTLRSLRLGNRFNATLTRNSPSMIGLLRQVKDYVTWGDLKSTDLATLLKERGEVIGGMSVTDKYAKDVFSKESIDSLATALTSGEISLQSLWEKGVKPVFRLRPPSGGFESTIKKSYTSNGQLGYRGVAIATLMTQMT